MNRPFTSYLSAGLLTTALTAALFTKLNDDAFALLSLTAGIATRSLRRCYIGLMTSLGFALILAVLVPSAGSDSPPGPAFDWWWGSDLAALWGALVGAALQLPAPRLIMAALGSSLISLVVLLISGAMLRAHLALAWRVLESWEYATILLTVPIVDIGGWWPVNIVAKSRT